MKTPSLRLGLALLTLLCACDPQERCVADCDGGTDTDPDPVPLTCEEDRDAATEFIDQNSACETVLDCVPADGFCLEAASCGTIALSNTADLDAWSQLNAAMDDSCGPCEAAECGPELMCNEAKQCEVSFGSADSCPNLERDVETFLAANRSCETAADCKHVDSQCRVDDCSAISVNINTNEEDWLRLDEALLSCESGGFATCNYVGECGFDVICTDEGQCASDW